MMLHIQGATPKNDELARIELPNTTVDSTAESRFSDCKYSEYSWFSEGITADHFITVT